MTCHTLEKLPDFNGDPKDDVLLEALVAKHPEHYGNLLNVEQKTWDNLAQRTEIEKSIWEGQAEFAATRDTFEEDALACFSRHGRPKMGCVDYCDGSKRIGSPTRHPGVKPVFLCMFCPVHSGYVSTEIRAKKGMYR